MGHGVCDEMGYGLWGYGVELDDACASSLAPGGADNHQLDYHFCYFGAYVGNRRVVVWLSPDRECVGGFPDSFADADRVIWFWLCFFGVGDDHERSEHDGRYEPLSDSSLFWLKFPGSGFATMAVASGAGDSLDLWLRCHAGLVVENPDFVAARLGDGFTLPVHDFDDSAWAGGVQSPGTTRPAVGESEPTLNKPPLFETEVM